MSRAPGQKNGAALLGFSSAANIEGGAMRPGFPNTDLQGVLLMDRSLYARPKKPLYVRSTAPVEEVSIDETAIRSAPIAVGGTTECHVTPLDVARRMVAALDLVGATSVLEPSAGTGNLIAALTEAGCPLGSITAVERDYCLSQHLVQRFDGLAVETGDFLEHAGQYDAIVMNPPFSAVRKHMAHALSLLPDARSGALVALVPVTFEHERFCTLETLPSDTFKACRVHTKLVINSH